MAGSACPGAAVVAIELMIESSRSELTCKLEFELRSVGAPTRRVFSAEATVAAICFGCS